MGSNNSEGSHGTLPKAFSDSFLNPMLEISNSSKLLVKKIAEANFVLAGSLHAAIVAYALGTPFWFRSKLDQSALVKYEDFSSTLNVEINLTDDLQQAYSRYSENV